eukprot:1192947-Prorocentrum_minimum.AAC.3
MASSMHSALFRHAVSERVQRDSRVVGMSDCSFNVDLMLIGCCLMLIGCCLMLIGCRLDVDWMLIGCRLDAV